MDDRSAQVLRLSAPIKAGLKATAASLAVSQNAYIEDAIQRAIAADAKKVAAANQSAESEILRLSQSAQELVDKVAHFERKGR